MDALTTSELKDFKKKSYLKKESRQLRRMHGEEKYKANRTAEAIAKKW